MVGPVLAASDCPVRDNIETPMTERPAEWTCVTSWNGYLLRWGGGRGVKYLSKLCLMRHCIVNVDIRTAYYVVRSACMCKSSDTAVKISIV